MLRYKLCDIIMSPTQDGPITSIFMPPLSSLALISTGAIQPGQIGGNTFGYCFERLIVTRGAQLG